MFKLIQSLQIMLLVTLLSAIIGCSSDVPNKSYFQLTSNLANHGSTMTQSTHYFIWIESIEVADFLNKSGIVLQTDDIKYTTATNHLWVSALSQQLAERLSQDLTQIMPNYLVSTNSITTPSLTVKLFIDGFHGNYNGDAIITGRWVMTDKSGKIVTKVIKRQIPLTTNGYDALVKALSQGWQDEELDFANSIKH